MFGFAGISCLQPSAVLKRHHELCESRSRRSAVVLDDTVGGGVSMFGEIGVLLSIPEDVFKKILEESYIFSLKMKMMA